MICFGFYFRLDEVGIWDGVCLTTAFLRVESKR